MAQRRSPHRRPFVTPRNALEGRRKYQLRSSPSSLKRTSSLSSPHGSESDATPRAVLSPLQPNLRRLPSRMRSLLFERGASDERDDNTQAGRKRKRVASGIENAYERVTRLANKLKRRRTTQRADTSEEEPLSDTMDVDNETYSPSSEKSDVETLDSSAQDELLTTASSQQLRRLRKDVLVELFGAAGLIGDADAMTKPAIVEAIIASRDDFPEVPPSSPRGASSGGYSSEEANDAGGEETDFANGRDLFQHGMRRRATVQEFPKSSPRPLKGRSISMNCLETIPPTRKAARFADHVSSPMHTTRKRNASDRVSHAVQDGPSLSSPPHTRQRSRKVSSGSGPSSSTSSLKSSAKTKQVDFVLSESDLTELDDLDIPTSDVSPRRLRSKDKIDSKPPESTHDNGEGQRHSSKRKARSRAVSLRDTMIEEEAEEEASAQLDSQDDTRRDVNVLPSSPTPSATTANTRQGTPLVRRLRPRKPRPSQLQEEGASDGDDEEEVEEEVEMGDDGNDEEDESEKSTGDEGEETEVEEPRRLRNGKVLGEEVEVDDSQIEHNEDEEEQSTEESDVPENQAEDAMDEDLTIATAKSLGRLRRDDLVRLCESRAIEVEGTKPQLVEALLQWRDQNADASSPSSTGTARPPSTTRLTRRRSSGRRTRSSSKTPPILERPDRIHNDDPRTPAPVSSGKGEPELELDLESLGLEDREIPPDKLTKLEKIGSGGFKDVFTGKFRGRKVAIAEFRGQLSAMDIKELKLLGGFNHPNIVRFLGVSIPENTKETPVMIISELCSNGDLFDYIRNVTPPSIRKVLQIMRDIAKGLEYLHLCKPSVIHRDCKSSNILITAKGVAKIADFGLAKVKQSTRSMVRSLVGTVNWQAPELWHAHPKYNHKVDVFSCALVFWEMLQWHQSVKKFPWEGMNEHAIYEAVGSKRQRPSINGLRRQWCPEIVDLMERMWAQEHTERPTMSEVVVELEELLTKY